MSPDFSVSSTLFSITFKGLVLLGKEREERAAYITNQQEKPNSYNPKIAYGS
jgi:hypothetical protein